MTKTSKTRNKHLGSSFADYLQEQGVASSTNAIAIKRVLAWQLAQAMEKDQISKNQMAKAMSTSRSQLDRILDPANERIQLDTIIKAAQVLGRKLRIELV
jgi:antitoxin HicB